MPAWPGTSVARRSRWVTCRSRARRSSARSPPRPRRTTPGSASPTRAHGWAMPPAPSPPSGARRRCPPRATVAPPRCVRASSSAKSRKSLPAPRAGRYSRSGSCLRSPPGARIQSQLTGSHSQGTHMAPTVTAAPQWVLHPNHAPEAAGSIARSLGAPLALGHALVNRGIRREDAARRFLDPVLEDLHEPTDMLDLDAAAERVLAAVAADERVFVHGDYDVDGITSTFLLYSAIEELGGRAEFRIPHRIRDGYGLTTEAIDEAHRRGCKLVVTVDCGITATEAVAYARMLGIDTVITDHHEPPARLPDAVAIVNPLRPGCTYPFKSLAGVGVTFKL